MMQLTDCPNKDEMIKLFFGIGDLRPCQAWEDDGLVRASSGLLDLVPVELWRDGFFTNETDPAKSVLQHNVSFNPSRDKMLQ